MPGTWAILLVAALFAYLSGSVPYGVLVARRRSVDLRTVGSGNIGATNAARALGWRAGLLVLVLDAIKGAAPVLLTSRLVGEAPAGQVAVALAGLMAVVGHCFPVWLRLRGGKGVATALGVFAVVAPLPTLAAAALVAVVYGLFRVVSAGSLLAAPLMPLLMWWQGQQAALLGMAAAIALLVLARHAGNIRRLLMRREHRL